MGDIVIFAKGLSKRHRIGHREPYKTLRDTLARAVSSVFRISNKKSSKLHDNGTSNHHGYFWALKDVTLTIRKGEIVGIIGRNGAGKSTLLKILSRIVEPTEGSVSIRGRIGSLLEVGTGFHAELTGRENVFLNGAILGMKKKEIKAKFDEIIAFSEIEKFLDTPVKYYSSGMYVRLAFAVAAHLEPDILLIDEVLAVGDAAFQKKCLGKMEDVAGGGRTILFVSHNMQTIRTLCSRCFLLDRGKIDVEGPTPQVIERYMVLNFGTPRSEVRFDVDPSRKAQVVTAALKNKRRKSGRNEVHFDCQYLIRNKADDVLLCVEVRNSFDTIVFYSNDSFVNDDRKRNTGLHRVVLTIPTYLLTPGEYTVSFGLWRPGHAPEHFPDVRLSFRLDEPITHLSAHGIRWPGILYIPGRWKYFGNKEYVKD